jgi:putative RecB family exonuclease
MKGIEQSTATHSDRPRSIADLTETVSASRLATWQRCRLQFYFRYVAGIRKPLTPALHIGRTVHSVLQQWSLGRWHKRPLPSQALKKIFLCAWDIWQQGQEINWNGEEAACQSAVWNVLDMYFRNTPIRPNEEVEGVEMGAEADLSSHGLPKLVGVIDLVRAKRRIVNFKTTSRTPDAEMLAHTTETQTTSYGLLYREATGFKEGGIELHHLIRTKLPRLVVTKLGPVRESQKNRLFRVMDAYVKGLDREDFTPSPGLQCRLRVL